MRVFVTGATGVVGRRAVPLLRSQRHRRVMARHDAAVNRATHIPLAGCVRSCRVEAVTRTRSGHRIPEENPDRNGSLEFATRMRAKPKRMTGERAETRGRCVTLKLSFAYGMNG